MYARLFLSCVVLAVVGCKSSEEGPTPVTQPPPLAAGEVDAAPLRVQRLTSTQYRRIVRDIFGDVAVPQLEPDFSAGGLISVGAAETSISPWGVERYEVAAFTIAQQVLAEGPARDTLVGCQPSAPDDEECARSFLADIAQQAWRGPVDAAELDRIINLATGAGNELQDFYVGLQFGIAAILQSPNFLYRAEYGEAASDGQSELQYTNYEMASRLSFLFWNTAPDAQLLESARKGELTTDEGIRAAAERLLASNRAREGVRNFFDERFELYHLDKLSKDPTVFTYFSPDLGASAKEQTLKTLEHLVFDTNGDFRSFFTSRKTFVDRRLAALYGLPAKARTGFAEVELQSEDRRRGFMGHTSFLALQAHAVGTSATLRGKFVLEVVLCRSVPPPPADANTAIPEVSATARTLRERLTVHMENPVCATCHRSMDGIGLTFEKFDGIGRRRELDNGVPIDTSGVLDDIPFADAWELGQVIHDHPEMPRCFVRSWYEYATGNRMATGEAQQVDDLTARFERSGFKTKDLLVEIVLSPGFRRASEEKQ